MAKSDFTTGREDCKERACPSPRRAVSPSVSRKVPGPSGDPKRHPRRADGSGWAATVCPERQTMPERKVRLTAKSSGWQASEAQILSLHPHSCDDILSLDAEVFGGGKKMFVVGVDFAEAVFLGAGEVEGIGSAEEDIARERGKVFGRLVE